MAPGADEGRGKAAKSPGELPGELIPGFPNGETRMGLKPHAPPPEHIGRKEGTGGTETSQYPEEKKSKAPFGVSP